MTIIEARHVRSARKPWTCDGCGRRFDVGTPKERMRILGYDGPYNWQSCPTCQAIADALCEIDSDYRHDGVRSDQIEDYMLQEFGSWEEADRRLAIVEGDDRG